MHRTHAGHGSIWPAEAVEAHASLDAAERLERQVRAKQQEIEEIAARAQENYERALAAERLASCAREEALREAIEICKEADAQDDRDNGACSAFNEALVMLRSLSDDKKKLVNLLASDTRVDAILEAVLTPRGDPEDGTRDHLPRALRDYLGKVGATSFKTGWNDGYAEGFGKAEAEAAARIRSLSSRVEEAERARREEELREDARLGAALARAESSEALVAELREKVERLRKALEPFAEAATKGEIRGYPPNYFVGATEFENARRACTALEGRDDG